MIQSSQSKSHVVTVVTVVTVVPLNQSINKVDPPSLQGHGDSWLKKCEQVMVCVIESAVVQEATLDGVVRIVKRSLSIGRLELCALDHY